MVCSQVFDRDRCLTIDRVLLNAPEVLNSSTKCLVHEAIRRSCVYKRNLGFRLSSTIRCMFTFDRG